jgi:hypothetical protein
MSVLRDFPIECLQGIANERDLKPLKAKLIADLVEFIGVLVWIV